MAIITLKINGMEMFCDTTKMHDSWIGRCLEYGIRRLPNDKNSGLEGSAKFHAVQAFVTMMENGEPMPIKLASSRKSRNPVMDLAMKTAKADLVTVFKTKFNISKIAQFESHATCGKYFDDGKWIDSEVDEFIFRKAEKGIDYIGRAMDLINVAQDEDI